MCKKKFDTLNICVKILRMLTRLLGGVETTGLLIPYQATVRGKLSEVKASFGNNKKKHALKFSY